ncbi:hypothetical protein J7J69_00680 [candidate division WOR-3 bacterium]|nr:hypothetical protein [candidate division WOR-3 bacterium]
MQQIIFLIISITWPPNVLVWDNDGGQTFKDPELDRRVGVEYNLVRALRFIGIDPEVTPSLPDSATLADYDILFIVNGWRDGDFIPEKERNLIRGYLNIGHSVYLEGNNVVYNYSEIDPDFVLRFGSYSHFDGNPVGNIDTVFGQEGTPVEGMEFDYPFGTEPDSSVDDIQADESYGGQADTFFIGVGRGKAYWAAAVGYGYGNFKASPYRTLTSSVVFGALQSTGSVPDSIYRATCLLRMLAYFGWPRILLVRDDYYTDNYMDSEVLLRDLQTLEKPYDTWYVSQNEAGPAYGSMCKYAIVIWDCGADNRRTIGEDIDEIKAYLSFGGRFMLIGDSIAPDLESIGAIGFLEDYFRVEYLGQASYPPEEIHGLNFLSGLSSPYDATYGEHPSVIDSITPSFPVFEYYSAKGRCAGISYRYMDEGRANGARTTFLGFPWSGIREEKTRQATLDSLIHFSGGGNYLYSQSMVLTTRIEHNGIVLLMNLKLPPGTGITLKRVEPDSRVLMETVFTGQPIVYFDTDVKEGLIYRYQGIAEINGKVHVVWSMRIPFIKQTAIAWDFATGMLVTGDEYKLLDAAGRVITILKPGHWNLKSMLPSGIYFLSDQNNRVVEKISVLK